MPEPRLAVCMIGAIGSGKTEIATRLAAEHTMAYISPDAMMRRHDYKERITAWSATVAHEYLAVKMGLSFVLDTASRVLIARQEMTSVIRAWDAGTPDYDFKVVGVYVTAPLKDCLARNAGRDQPVPEDQVRAYWAALDELPPQCEDGFDVIYHVPNGPDVELAQIVLPTL